MASESFLIYMPLYNASIIVAACPQTLQPLSGWFETDPPFSEVDQITTVVKLLESVKIFYKERQGRF